ncbi:MAG: hypothetical protein UV70_C0009G0004 [Parcubacteria group bacterium GW2011_GWA2_43_13]|nr:MAG: hypothetical protein UV70_C0009G0004 [Parcubacteria group bacterium GW2011_GWA2_43_13]OGY71112.1 MAG: CRISPR-associated protein Csx3 [Candidatus Jacksonbacteria bacterium RIFCSPLOWO2_01_FULL_44_13]
MAYYKVEIIERGEATTLRLAFGEPAQNDVIVRDAVAAVQALNLEGGKVIRLNGPASLPVAIAIGHVVAHLYGAVAAFDPKLGKYVVAVSHDPEFEIGQLID